MTHYGFCCILLKDGFWRGSDFKTTTQKWLKQNSEQSETKLLSIWKHNIKELEYVLKYLNEKNIKLYRISSDLFPFADHNDYGYLWENFLSSSEHWESIQRKCQNYIESGGRLVTHPSQFCVISSPKDLTRINSIRNLEYHGQMFDRLGLPQNYSAGINIHISNGSKGEQVVEFVKESLKKLSKSVTSRLVFENEQSGYWNPVNIRKHFPEIPCTLDSHHLAINPSGRSFEEDFNDCVDSWKQHNQIPVFHYSEGKKHPLDIAHSDYVQNFPKWDVFVEIEAKMKNLAIIKEVKL
jgi:UV DNA damage endonuclease